MHSQAVATREARGDPAQTSAAVQQLAATAPRRSTRRALGSGRLRPVPDGATAQVHHQQGPTAAVLRASTVCNLLYRAASGPNLWRIPAAVPPVLGAAALGAADPGHTSRVRRRPRPTGHAAPSARLAALTFAEGQQQPGQQGDASDLTCAPSATAATSPSGPEATDAGAEAGAPRHLTEAPGLHAGLNGQPRAAPSCQEDLTGATAVSSGGAARQQQAQGRDPAPAPSPTPSRAAQHHSQPQRRQHMPLPAAWQQPQRGSHVVVHAGAAIAALQQQQQEPAHTLSATSSASMAQPQVLLPPPGIAAALPSAPPPWHTATLLSWHTAQSAAAQQQRLVLEEGPQGGGAPAYVPPATHLAAHQLPALHLAVAGELVSSPEGLGHVGAGHSDGSRSDSGGGGDGGAHRWPSPSAWLLQPQPLEQLQSQEQTWQGGPAPPPGSELQQGEDDPASCHARKLSSKLRDCNTLQQVMATLRRYAVQRGSISPAPQQKQQELDQQPHPQAAQQQQQQEGQAAAVALLGGGGPSGGAEAALLLQPLNARHLVVLWCTLARVVSVGNEVPVGVFRPGIGGTSASPTGPAAAAGASPAGAPGAAPLAEQLLGAQPRPSSSPAAAAVAALPDDVGAAAAATAVCHDASGRFAGAATSTSLSRLQLVALRQVLVRLEQLSLACVASGAWRPEDAVTCAWAMARLGHRPAPRWLAAWVVRTGPALAGLGARHLANAVWAAATLEPAAAAAAGTAAQQQQQQGVRPGAAWVAAAVARAVELSRRREFVAQGHAAVLWALCRLAVAEQGSGAAVAGGSGDSWPTGRGSGGAGAGADAPRQEHQQQDEQEQMMASTHDPLQQRQQHPFSASQLSCLLRHALEDLQRMQPHHTSMMLWSLGHLCSARHPAALPLLLAPPPPGVGGVPVSSAAVGEGRRQQEQRQLRRLLQAQAAALWSSAARWGAHALGPQGTANTLWAAAHMQLAVLPPRDDKPASVASAQHSAAAAVQALVEGSLALLPSMSPQQLYNLAWAMAVMQVPPPGHAWVHALLLSARSQLGDCSAQALSGLLWACCRLGVKPGPSWMAALVRMVEARAGELCATSLPLLLWSLAALRYAPGLAWSKALTQRVARLPQRMRAQGVAVCAAALARLRLPPHPAWSDALTARAQQLLPPATAAAAAQPPAGFSPQELAMCLQGLARLGVAPGAGCLDAAERQLLIWLQPLPLSAPPGGSPEAPAPPAPAVAAHRPQLGASQRVTAEAPPWERSPLARAGSGPLVACLYALARLGHAADERLLQAAAAALLLLVPRRALAPPAPPHGPPSAGAAATPINEPDAVWGPRWGGDDGCPLPALGREVELPGAGGEGELAGGDGGGRRAAARDLAQGCWALAMLGHEPPLAQLAQLAQLARPLLRHMGHAELAQCTWALHRMGLAAPSDGWVLALLQAALPELQRMLPAQGHHAGHAAAAAAATAVQCGGGMAAAASAPQPPGVPQDGALLLSVATLLRTLAAWAPVAAPLLASAAPAWLPLAFWVLDVEAARWPCRTQEGPLPLLLHTATKHSSGPDIGALPLLSGGAGDGAHAPTAGRPGAPLVAVPVSISPQILSPIPGRPLTPAGAAAAARARAWPNPSPATVSAPLLDPPGVAVGVPPGSAAVAAVAAAAVGGTVAVPHTYEAGRLSALSHSEVGISRKVARRRLWRGHRGLVLQRHKVMEAGRRAWVQLWHAQTCATVGAAPPPPLSAWPAEAEGMALPDRAEARQGAEDKAGQLPQQPPRQPAASRRQERAAHTGQQQAQEADSAGEPRPREQQRASSQEQPKEYDSALFAMPEHDLRFMPW